MIFRFPQYSPIFPKYAIYVRTYTMHMFYHYPKKYTYINLNTHAHTHTHLIKGCINRVISFPFSFAIFISIKPRYHWKTIHTFMSDFILRTLFIRKTYRTRIWLSGTLPFLCVSVWRIMYRGRYVYVCCVNIIIIIITYREKKNKEKRFSFIFHPPSFKPFVST